MTEILLYYLAGFLLGASSAFFATRSYYKGVYKLDRLLTLPNHFDIRLP